MWKVVNSCFVAALLTATPTLAAPDDPGGWPTVHHVGTGGDSFVFQVGHRVNVILCNTSGKARKYKTIAIPGHWDITPRPINAMTCLPVNGIYALTLAPSGVPLSDWNAAVFYVPHPH